MRVKSNFKKMYLIDETVFNQISSKLPPYQSTYYPKTQVKVNTPIQIHPNSSHVKHEDMDKSSFPDKSQNESQKVSNDLNEDHQVKDNSSTESEVNNIGSEYMENIVLEKNSGSDEIKQQFSDTHEDSTLKPNFIASNRKMRQKSTKQSKPYARKKDNSSLFPYNYSEKSVEQFSDRVGSNAESCEECNEKSLKNESRVRQLTSQTKNETTADPFLSQQLSTEDTPMELEDRRLQLIPKYELYQLDYPRQQQRSQDTKMDVDNRSVVLRPSYRLETNDAYSPPTNQNSDVMSTLPLPQYQTLALDKLQLEPTVSNTALQKNDEARIGVETLSLTQPRELPSLRYQIDRGYQPLTYAQPLPVQYENRERRVDVPTTIKSHDLNHTVNQEQVVPRKSSTKVTYTCTICNEDFKSKSTLIRHNKNIHEAFYQTVKGEKRKKKEGEFYPNKKFKNIAGDKRKNQSAITDNTKKLKSLPSEIVNYETY